MNENSRVMVRVEYENEGMMRVWYGEIDKLKLEDFHSGKEDFIWMENDGKLTWKDKHSIISINKLEKKTNLYEKTSIGPHSRVQDART